jgi:hypothetical protein
MADWRAHAVEENREQEVSGLLDCQCPVEGECSDGFALAFEILIAQALDELTAFVSGHHCIDLTALTASAIRASNSASELGHLYVPVSANVGSISWHSQRM